MLQYAIVTEVSLMADGYPSCTITDERNGATMTGCKFLGVGGGTQSSISYSPPAVGARVLYGFVRGTSQAVVLGVTHSPLANAKLTDAQESSSYDEEFNAQIGPYDRCAEQGGTWVFLTNDGQLVIDSSQSQMPVRVQLGIGYAANLRISQNNEADEGILLAGPTRDYLDGLRSALDDTRVQLAKVMTYVNVLTAVPGKPPTFSPDTLASLAVPGLSTTDDLVASAVKISSRSILEDWV